MKVTNENILPQSRENLLDEVREMNLEKLE
jgi:hypothetical protein